MEVTKTDTFTFSDFIKYKVKAYFELTKPRLSFLVAFSAGFGYTLGIGNALSFAHLMALCVGGFLVTGASVTINQIMEINQDKVMSRTCNRPLPAGKVSGREALSFAGLTFLAGIMILLLTTNILTGFLAVLSLVLYCFAYTPLKRVGQVAVFVGAIPGALPPLLGWTAATGHIGYEALILFGIQFIWQFPHFWAIAWVADDDYKKAGFKLLPVNGQKDFHSAVQIMIYTLFLLPVSLLPLKFGLTGINSAIVVIVCGVLFLSQTFKLMADGSRKSALKIMFGSFIYLPVVQIAFLLDKV